MYFTIGFLLLTLKKSMKKSNSINICFIILAIVLLGCSKDNVSSPSPTPPPAKPLPATPTTLTVTADTALFNGSSTVKVITDAQLVQVGGITVLNGTITFTSLKKDTTLTFIATNTNANGSSSKTIAFTIKVWSLRTTQVNNYTPVHFVSSKSCIAGTENSPTVVWSVFNPSNLPCDSYKFYANGRFELTYGPCRIFPDVPGTVHTSGTRWIWSNPNETAIDFGSDIWDITLNYTGFTRTQTSNGYYTIQVLSQ